MFSAALSFIMSNGKSIIIVIIIAIVLGTFAFQQHKITSLESSNKTLSDQVTLLKNAVKTAKESIENCNTGKTALEDQNKELIESKQTALANCSKIDLTFKNALNTTVKKEQITNEKRKANNIINKYLKTTGPDTTFTVMTKEKSDETIDLYNTIFKPFIRN